MIIKGYRLEKTCDACPEQYDVYKDGAKVAYLRLRHGSFRAEVNGITVYTAYPQGDGVFEEDERMYYLVLAIKAIDDHLNGVSDDYGDDDYYRCAC